MKRFKEVTVENPYLKRLTARQKLFAERCLQSHTYRSHVAAYVSVYLSSGNRLHDVVNASRIYNRPAVQAYVAQILAEEAKLAALESRRQHEEFLKSLKVGKR